MEKGPGPMYGMLESMRDVTSRVEGGPRPNPNMLALFAAALNPDNKLRSAPTAPNANALPKAPPNFKFYKSNGKAIETEDDIDLEFFSDHLEERITAIERPPGSQMYPARSCQDLKLAYPEAKSGQYWMDPNSQNPADAFIVECIFEKEYSETCVLPTTSTWDRMKWVNKGKDAFRWFFQEITDYEINYPADTVQLELLRIEHESVSQNITYHCKNSHANLDSYGRFRDYLKVRSSDDYDVTTSTRDYKLKVSQDECNKKDDKWHKAVFELITNRKEHFPVVDVAVYDVADKNEEFGIEVGPVCFR